MRLTFGLIGSVALAMALIGCGGAPAGPTLAPGQTATPAPATLVPGATATPGSPSTPGTVVLTGHECDAVPTMDPANPVFPEIPPDTELNSHFPATIDGQPVTDVSSQQLAYYICFTQGQAGLEAAVAQAGGGFNSATLSWGSAKATVDGEEVELTAFRTPGANANAMVQYLSLLAAQSGTAINPGNVQSTNVAGKAVFVWTDSDGSKSYAYPSGDTLIFFDGVTDSQATKILTALP